MKKIYLDILREIRKSIGRFLSIFAIVAIGVAFFAGIKASAPLMKETADEYFDEHNLQDIQIYSTLGFVDEDIEKIREIEGVEGVHATHSMDALFRIDANEYVYKVMTIPKDFSEDNPDYINQAVLVEGRMPQNDHECLIEVGEIATVGIQIGQKIDLYSGTDTPIEESLNTTSLEVVGLVKSPYYLSYQKGSTSIGDGSLDGFLLVFDDNFKSDIYTEVYVTVKGSKAFNSYHDNYFEDCIDPVRKKINKLANERASLRTEEVKEMALEELSKKESEFLEKKEEAEKQLKDAEKQLQKAYEEITYNESYIRDLEKTITSVKDKLNQEIDAAKTQLEILKAQKILGANSNSVKELEKMLDDVNSALDAMSEEEKSIENEEYLNLLIRKQTIEVLIEVVSSEAAEEELDKAIQVQEEVIEKLQKELNSTINAYEKQLSDGKTQLKEGRAQYEAGVEEYNKNKLIAEEELADAQEKLDKARSDIENMSEGEWYVLDRKSHYSYMDYGAAADRMDNIAKIFPLFFFLVAALICLTTMTRMVDEQRGVIGTLKALGYSKGAIAIRYLSYAFISSVFGCIVGVFVGFAVFPTLIVHLWNMMYTVPDAGFKFYGDLALLASGSCVLIVMLATWFAVNKELKETPALLMRPKAPSNGKRIFLERVHFIWDKLTFTYKVTCRNLFRYKKRFFMTVIGISGCTALLVAGYGIQDSINGIVSIQYDEIYQYDANIYLDESLNVVEKNELMTSLLENEYIKDLVLIAHESSSVNIKNKDQAVDLLIVDDEEKFAEFHVLRDRNTHEPVEIPEKGVIISEKMASDLGIGSGDKIEVEANDMVVHFVVEDVFENYIGHSIIMNTSTYKDAFGVSSKTNQLLLRETNGSEKVDSILGTYLNDLEEVESVSFFNGLSKNFTDMISSLSIVVVVLVVSSGLLAFVVLYNLTNVNVSERIREIATLKVLGFYDKEVSSYVFRENLLLSIIGSFAGLGLGTFLHRMIMSLAEMDNVMFGRIIEVKSYALGFVITMFFSWVVAKFMHYRLKNIPMVESLKSVE